jgi:hypothetical protein
MKTLRRSMILAAVILTIFVQQASAQKLILLGTTGACNSAVQGGPCTAKSTLVQLNPQTGKLMKTIGPVGFTVNGLAWDSASKKLYASTSVGDVRFHGLITINPLTGRGTPVNRSAVNFGLAGNPSPIHSIAIDPFGHMVGWYDENPPPDTFVRINKNTGVAKEFPGTGINTSQNGLSFDQFNLLWNIDAPRIQPGDTSITQTAYIINPYSGIPMFSRLLDPPTPAAIGAFHPGNHLYYGLNFDTSLPPPFPTSIVKVNPVAGTAATLGSTVADLHTLAFIKGGL